MALDRGRTSTHDHIVVTADPRAISLTCSRGRRHIPAGCDPSGVTTVEATRRHLDCLLGRRERTSMQGRRCQRCETARCSQSVKAPSAVTNTVNVDGIRATLGTTSIRPNFGTSW